jgi:hypothetical protein
MGVSDVIGAAPWSHSTVSGWNCSGSDHFPFGDDALGDDHRGGSYHDGGGSESGQRWRSMTARVRVRWPTPLLTAARQCGSGGNSNSSGPAILGIGVGDHEGNELCVPTSGDPARAERSQVDGGSESERWTAP